MPGSEAFLQRLGVQASNTSNLQSHTCFVILGTFPDPMRDPKTGAPPIINPLLPWGKWEIIRGFHFLDPLGGFWVSGPPCSDRMGFKVQGMEQAGHRLKARSSRFLREKVYTYKWPPFSCLGFRKVPPACKTPEP